MIYSSKLLSIIKLTTICSLSLLYIFVGVKHFSDAGFFLVIVPPYIKFPHLAVYLSGFFEIVFGLLLIPTSTRKFAGIGIIVLLISVFPANIYLYISEVPQKIYGITKNEALLRLPFQLPLILLAYWHSKEKTSKTFDLFSIFIFIPTIIYFLTL